MPKPPKANKAPVPKPPYYETYASARGGGRGSKEGVEVVGVNGVVVAVKAMQLWVEGSDGMGQRAGGRAQRGRGTMVNADVGITCAQPIASVSPIGRSREASFKN
ncbi:hypothetical protein Tco_0847349 [Tanacetum coccineum]